MTNPFETISNRLGTLETLMLQMLDRVDRPATAPEDENGGIELAVKVLDLAKPTIYALVSKGQLPHSKRGNRLYFNRTELLAWISEGKRNTATN